MDKNCLQASDPRFVGDPVDTFTGAVLDRQLDFRLAGPLPLQWWRRYDSSRAGQVFSLGWGSEHEFAVRLTFDVDGIRYTDPFGVITDFPPLEKDGASFSSAGKTLTRANSRVYQLFEHAAPTREFVFGPKDSVAKLCRVFDTQGEIQFSYDAQNNLCGLVDSLGRTIEIIVDRQGLIQEIAFPQIADRDRRTLVAYSYDRHQNLVGVRNQFEHSFGMQYDHQHRLTQRIDRNGYAFQFEYDARGYCIKTTGEDGVLENRIDYVAPGEATEVTRGNGGRWRYHYQLGRLVQIDDPLGGQEKFVYDDQGKSLQDIDTNGNVTTSIYDASGALIGKRSPLGHVSSRPVDLNEPQPLAHRVAQNAAEYEFGRLVDVQAIAASKPTQPADAAELHQRPATYFEQANLYSTPTLGFVVGHNWWPEPSTGRQFDLTGDLIHQIDRHGRKRRWVYDGNGNVVKYVDFDGGVWTYEYGSWNHLLRETNPLGYSNAMEYDSQENLTSFQDAGGTRSEYAYDLKDSLVEVRRHGQMRERYQRDAAGNLIAKYAADGRLLLKLEYGPGNLLAKRTLASGEEHTYTYDESGRYVVAASRQFVVDFQYDVTGNRTNETRNGLGVKHVYRGWRQFGQSVWFEKFVIRYEEKSDGSLEIVDPCGGHHCIKVEQNGQVERRFSNGTIEKISYDELGRCLSKSTSVLGGGSWKRTYSWSGEAELRRVEDSRFGTTAYEYDVAHRLARRTRLNGTRDDFEFDKANNLVSQPGLEGVQILQGNRLGVANGEEFEYNDRNHICRRSSLAGDTTYFYDSRDQLTRVESPQGVWEAEYDALGRRARQNVNGLVTEYFWNSDQLAAEIGPTGQLRLYIYADPLAQTPLMFIDYESINAAPSSGQRYFLFSDQVGTALLIVDNNCQEVWRATHEPFGEARLAATNKIDFNLRSPGHYWDQFLNLNYNRFRWYSPTLGRYIQSDPMGIAGGSNLYSPPTNPLHDQDVIGLSCPACDAGKKKPAECGPDDEPLQNQKGRIDDYGELKKTTGDGSCDRDHQPSKAALKRRARDLAQQDGRIVSQAQWAEIDRQIENQSQAVVVPRDIHRAGPTHGHKNTTAQIQSDANDLAGAATRDSNTMVTNSQAMDPANTANYQNAANQIQSKSNADYDNFLNGIMDDS